MTPNKLRRTIYLNRALVKNLMITDNQIEIIKTVAQCGSITSSDLAFFLSKTVQNVSTQLKILFKKGYLVRSEIKQESGGSEYFYRSGV